MYLYLRYISKVSSQSLILAHTTATVQPARQEGNCKRNFHKNFLINLENEVLTHSVYLRTKFAFKWRPYQYHSLENTLLRYF